MQYTAPRISLELAPYANAPTSILVYRGKGVLVRRCKTREEAVQLAIEEFSLNCDPRAVSLTTFVGVQGREVEVGRSAFAFLKDTIPIHVHVKEEDTSDNRETARWPAVSLDPQPLEYFGESVQSTLPTQVPQDGLASISKQNNTESSQSYTQTLEESVTDWRKGSSATSVTATSVHDTPHESLPTVKSPDEMTISNASPPDKSLVSELPTALPKQPTNGKPKNWDWLKKAGAAIGVGQSKSAAIDAKNQSQVPKEVMPALNGKATSVGMDESEDEGTSSPVSPPKKAVSKPLKPSRAPSNKSAAMLDNSSARGNGSRRQSLVAATKQKSREPSPTGPKKPQKSRGKRAPPSQPVSPSISGESAGSDWGPGGLVLEEDGSTWQTDSGAGSKVDGSWWTRSTPSVANSSNKGKVALKPLHLARSGSIASSISDGPSQGGTSQNGRSRNKRSPKSDRPTRPSPLSSPRQSKQKGSSRSRAASPARLPVEAQAAKARPMPDDMPESPASSKRFTKAADQLDDFALQQAPKRMPRGRAEDSVPLVPIAPPVAPNAASGKNKNRRSALISKPEVPVEKAEDDWPSTPVAEAPVAAVQPKKVPQRAPRRQPTGNDAWTKAGMGAVPAFHDAPVPSKQRHDTRTPSAEDAAGHEAPVKARLPHQAIQGGHFARAAFAARRQMSITPSERSPTGSSRSTASSHSSAPTTHSSRSARQDKRGDMRPTHPPARQRSSLSSLQDFVPAEVREEEDVEDSITGTSLQSSQATGTSVPDSEMTGTSFTGTETGSGSGSWMSGSSLPSIAESEATVQEGTSWTTSSTIPAKVKGGKVQRTASILSQSTALSRDSYAAGEADTVFLDRVILGPMDLSSPNRKGSQLVLKASPTTSQLSIEWKQEKKTVVSLGFNHLASVALPGPGCREKFIILRPKTGQVKEVLLELDKGNLLHFQRFILIIIMGEGAEIEHLQEDEFLDIVEANGW